MQTLHGKVFLTYSRPHPSQIGTGWLTNNMVRTCRLLVVSTPDPAPTYGNSFLYLTWRGTTTSMVATQKHQWNSATGSSPHGLTYMEEPSKRNILRQTP